MKDIKKKNSPPSPVPQPSLPQTKKRFYVLKGNVIGDSFYQFRMCVGDNPCEMCARNISKRRETDPNWHPTKVLQMLAWNNYWFPFPEFNSEALQKEALEEAELKWEPPLPEENVARSSRAGFPGKLRDPMNICQELLGKLGGHIRYPEYPR